MDDQHDATAIFGTPLSFSVLSGASFIGNPQFDSKGFVVAPGEIVTIFGSNLGPAALTTGQLDANGRLATVLAGTRILFDGVAAPLIYTSPNQVSAIVPFPVAGKTSTTVRTEYNGVHRGPALAISVSESAPGLFTPNASGTGQIAALNQDYSINSPSNPAEPNAVVQLFATGGGQWTDAIADGEITGSHLVAPKAAGLGPRGQAARPDTLRRHRPGPGEWSAADQHSAAQGTDRRSGGPDTDLGRQLHQPSRRDVRSEVGQGDRIVRWCLAISASRPPSARPVLQPPTAADCALPAALPYWQRRAAFGIDAGGAACRQIARGQGDQRQE